MNLIPDICEKLGVKIGERFNIKNGSVLIGASSKLLAEFTLEKDGLYGYSNTGRQYSVDMIHLLTGQWKVVKMQFQPKNLEEYYSISFINNDSHTLTVSRYLWDGTSIDNMRKHFKIVYRTKEEAEADKFNGFQRVVGII